jgi:hypothetical protein
MIIRLFKESHPATYIIVPAFILVFLTFSWQGAGEYVVQNPMPLYDLMLSLVLFLPEWLTGLIVYIILISQVFHLNYVIGKHEVFYRNSYLPALFYMIFVVMIPLFMTFHPVLIINSILIFVLDKLFKIYKNVSPLNVAFDVCFLIGVATLIYLPAISFFLLFAFSILILKTFSWRDWMVGITGLLLPFFFAFVYYFWNDGIEEMKSKFFLDDLTKILDTGGLVLQGYRITLVVVAIIVGLTLLRIRQNFYKNANRIRNFMQVMFMFLVVALISLAFTGSVAVYRFAILTIPIATLVSYYFLAGKKAWWSEVIFWVLMVVLVLNHLNIMA